MEIVEVEPASQSSVVEARRLRLRCPVCRHVGTLDERGVDLWISGGSNTNLVSAQRTCPNPTCRALIFVIYNVNSEEILVSYPPERIDFDASGIPEAVKQPLEEAIDSHAHGNYQACALMIRRALEAVCEDRGAEGSNLKKRIEVLGDQVVLPPQMFDGLHNLRLMGNDAAHVESRTYSEVGQEEIETALDVTKLILAATYQTSDALARLDALKIEASGDAEATS